MGNETGDFEGEAEAAYPALLRAATVLCWSRSDAEDVVQETMLRAYRSYGSFRRDSSFLTWAYAILTRVAAATNQQRSRQIPSQYADQAPQLPPVDAAVIEGDEARCAIEAIRSLPERQREMAVLHFLEDLSYKDIASTLGVSVGTVKAAIFAAKMSLRSALAKKKIGKENRDVVS
jgi:RNA polymerase sigma-70 factor, ECF subfamily